MNNSKSYIALQPEEGDLELFAFSDGSFKLRSDGVVQTGIRGYIKDKNDSLLYIFSGNSHAASPLHAEVKVLSFVLEALSSSNVKMQSLCSIRTVRY